jgi:hypothetical protein
MALPVPEYGFRPDEFGTDEDIANAFYLPSDIMSKLLYFDKLHSYHNRFRQSAADCLERLLEREFGYRWQYDSGGGRFGQFWTEYESVYNNDRDIKIRFRLAKHSFVSLPRWTFTGPIPPLDTLNSLTLIDLAKPDVDYYYRDIALKDDEEFDGRPIYEKPSYYKRMIEFMEARTPEFIQQVRAELARRYYAVILNTSLLSNDVIKARLLRALASCSGVAQPIALLTSPSSKQRTACFLTIPRGAKGEIDYDEIEDGDDMVAWGQNIFLENPRYYKKSSYNMLPTPKLDPYTREPIRDVTYYKARVAAKKANDGDGNENEVIPTGIQCSVSGGGKKTRRARRRRLRRKMTRRHR